jgi:ABC-type multidrug transport system ATPase subunit
MIRTHGLTKRYGPQRAVDGIDLDVRDGDIYGFLGANGSGKTTTVRMLLGLVLATSGEIELLGQAMPKSRHSVLPQVGALIEGPGAYGHLSGRANLTLMDASGQGGSRRTRRRRVGEALEQVGLDTVGRRPVRHYSLGMRQRLGLASAMLRTPRLLVLDEPTNGLDPQGIHEIRVLLQHLHSQGTTIFLSSHLLAEVEQLCTRVGVLDRGRLVLQAQMDDLRGPTGRTAVITSDTELAISTAGADRVDASQDGVLFFDDPDSAAVNAMLVGAGVRVQEIAPERRTLEQVVLAAATESGDRPSAASR